MKLLDRLNGYNMMGLDSPRRTEAPLWLAWVSWLLSRPGPMFWKMVRWKPIDLRYRLNMAAIRFDRFGDAYKSRYPQWASARGGPCGMKTPDGYHCEVSGLSHPGPHRINPNGPLEHKTYVPHYE